MKKIYSIRTHITVGTGGPIPPLELLYVASHIERMFGNQYDHKISDTGIGDLTAEDIGQEIRQFNPDIILLYALSWEAGLVHSIAQRAKQFNPDIQVIVFGQLATFSSQYVAEDENVDYVVVGEPELTVTELLKAFQDRTDIESVNGLVYRKDGKNVATAARVYPDNLDEFSISGFAWDLIDVKEYSKYLNWNGALKEDFYMPILTQRGCPFKCTFCRETYGKKFLARSPQHVVDEIKFLHERYGVKEIHFYDAVFNYDNKRAIEICKLIVEANLNISLAFPHGVRADIMTDDLLEWMRKAGTYKLVYGIESATPRLQKAFRKNLNLDQVRDRIKKASNEGIIVGGYFMLGHVSETAEEIQETIKFAVTSDLDVASFFKATNYNDVNKIYQNKLDQQLEDQEVFDSIKDIAYYSVNRSQADVSPQELNRLILTAQRKFYFNPRRIVRGFRKYPSKIGYLKNLMTALSLILQAYIMQSLTNSMSKDQPVKESLVKAAS